MNLKLDNLSSLSSFTRRFAYGSRTRPQRDWIILISLSLALLIVSAGWSYWLFHNASVDQGGSAASGANINVSVFDTVRTVFEKRATERAHYLNDYRFVDPSK